MTMHPIPRPKSKLCCLLLLLSFGATSFAKPAELVLSQPLTLRWLYASDRTTNFTPPTDGTTIYLPLTEGTLVALNILDGKLRWKAEAGGNLSAAPGRGRTDALRRH